MSCEMPVYLLVLAQKNIYHRCVRNQALARTLLKKGKVPMERAVEWWLVRHAPVHLPYIYGQRDVDADFSSAEQFTQLASMLPSDARSVSSDLRRCVKTAEKIRAELSNQAHPLICEKYFREQHFGDWEGLTYDQAKATNSDLYDTFWEDPARHSPPNGESFEEMMQRVSRGQKNITANYGDDKILLFAHAGTIRAMIAKALDIPLSKALSVVIEPLSLSKLTLFITDEEESWKVDWINRVPY